MSLSTYGNANRILNSTKHFIQSKGKFREFQLGKSEEIFINHLAYIHESSNFKDNSKEIENKDRKNDSLIKLNANLRSNFMEEQNKKFDNILTKKNRNFYPILKNSRIHMKTQNSISISSNSLLNESFGLITLPPITNIKPLLKKLDNNSARIFHNDIFLQKEFEGLDFKNEEFLDKSFIESIPEFIHNKYEQIINTNAYPDSVSKLSKTLSKQGNTFTLNFNSIIITISENKQGFKKELIEYSLPFSALALFYKGGIQSFIIMLTKLIKFDSETYDKVEIKEDYLFSFLRGDMKDENLSKIKPVKEEEKNIETDSIKNNETEIKENIKTKNTIKKRLTSVGTSNISPLKKKLKDFMIELLNENKVIDIEGSPIKNDPQTIKHKTENTNIYKLRWVTPNATYLVKITMPYVTLQELSTKIKISNYIHYNLLFYLYQRNFENWDYYLLNYLFSFSKCRRLLGKISSKIKFKDIQSNTHIYISEPLVDDYNLESKEIPFILTKKGDSINYLCNLYSLTFGINIYADDQVELLYYNYLYNINFSFEQAIKIFQCFDLISQEKLKYFLIKFANIKKMNLTYDFSVLNNSNESDLLYAVISKIKENSGIIEEKTENYELSKTKNYQICKEFFGPSIRIRYFNTLTKSNECGYCNVLDNMKDIFLNENITNWPTFAIKLNENHLNDTKETYIPPQIKILEKSKMFKA